MRHVRLGGTGLRVSQLCLGTMTFGAILDRAAAGGITFLDTSDVYPIGGNLGTVGGTEEIIGRWLAGRRHDFIVATKCFGAMSARPWDQGLSRKHILDAIEGSGKHRREAGPMAGTRFTHPTAGARYRDRYWQECELETVEALRPLAAEAGMSMTQMAVAWVLENPVVTAPIVGASRREQLDDSLAAVDKGLDESLKARLDDLTREYRWGDDIR
jgi:aryl-alcohol dehydrogenase-like predicted oxidoreductase